ncbi:MAG: hypothetical protein WCL16_12555 [bacterium]
MEYKLFITALSAAAIFFVRAEVQSAPAPRAGTGTKQSSYLYTAPDPAATGGIHGRIATPAKPMLKIFAQAADEWKHVYCGELADGGTEFRFKGLPVGKYDLLILYADGFYEGLSLNQDQNTLTDSDQSFINAAIMKSTPFFNQKKIHRSEGVTGYAGKARCVLQEVRTLPITLQSAEVRADIQVRSIKLVLPEDVGIGWSVVNTREIVRQEVAATECKGLLQHHFDPQLGNIRVIDTTKELGSLSLK